MRIRLWLVPAGLIALAGCGPEARRLVEFSPDPIEIGAMAAGTRTIEATVRNVAPRPLTRLALGGSCGCIEVLEPEGRFDLQPGESRRVRFAFQQLMEGPIRQLLTVQSRQTPEPIGVAKIVGRVLPAFDPPDQPISATVRRSVEGEPFRAAWSARPAFDGVVERVVSFHPDVRASFQQHGRALTIFLEGAPGVADGRLAVECHVRGRTPSGRFEYVRSPWIDLSSDLSVEPTAVWLGAVPAGSSRTADFVLRGPTAARVRVGSPEVATVTPDGPGSVRISVPVKAPSETGLFSRQIPILLEGERVCSLTVGGLARR